jgi:hypothetical protein
VQGYNTLAQPSFCPRSALALPSLCPRSALALPSLCPYFALALLSLCPRSVLALSLLCSCSTLTLPSLCPYSALISLCSRFVLVLSLLLSLLYLHFIPISSSLNSLPNMLEIDKSNRQLEITVATLEKKYLPISIICAVKNQQSKLLLSLLARKHIR